MMSRKKKGMLASFIDLRRAYDRVDGLAGRSWFERKIDEEFSESSLLGV